MYMVVYRKLISQQPNSKQTTKAGSKVCSFCCQSHSLVAYHANKSETLIHKMIVQPAMLYGMETVPVTSSCLKKLDVTEMKMCRWACGHTLRDHVRNDNIESIAERCMKVRLMWFGNEKRRYQEYVGRKTLQIVPPGRRKRGRPKQRWMDCVNRDIYGSVFYHSTRWMYLEWRLDSGVE